jgi:hypothetical protein
VAPAGHAGPVIPSRVRPPTLVAAGALVLALIAGCSSSSGGGATPTAPPSTDATGPTSTTPVAPSSPAPGSSSPAPSTPAASTRASSTHPVPSQPLKIDSVTSVDGKRTYSLDIWARHDVTHCYQHAHGQPMVTFLTTHPCNGMSQILATTTVDGRAVGFAQESLSLPGTAKNPYASAGKFQTLVEKDGTGSPNDLLREGYRLPTGPTSVPSPDAFNAMTQDTGATVWDVWYLDGSTPSNDKALIQMTRDIYLQFDASGH